MKVVSLKIFLSKKFNHEGLGMAVYKWWVEQRSEGFSVRGLHTQNAAKRLANHLELEHFKN